jgi:hypothetical protein
MKATFNCFRVFFALALLSLVSSPIASGQDSKVDPDSDENKMFRALAREHANESATEKPTKNLNDAQRAKKQIDRKKKEAKADQARLNKIPSAARNQVSKFLLPALRSGSSREFMRAMENLVVKHSPETIVLIEEYCKSQGFGQLDKHLTRFMTEAISQGTSPFTNSKPKPKFVMFASAALGKHVESELEEFEQHLIMQDPLQASDDWLTSEDTFWEVHVWKNRFLNLDRFVRFAISMNEPHLKRANRNDDVDDQALLKAPQLLRENVTLRYRELLEREAELRMLELAKAEETLRLKPSFEDELHAAFALEMHGGELDIFFRQHKAGTFARQRLNDQQEIEKAAALLKSGREHGKEVMEKAVLLRIGAHWWLRGRYGMGGMAAGLLKPPAAMNSKAIMFGLFMPKERSLAVGQIDPETGTYSPGYERRHYFTWAVERRDVYTSVNGASSSKLLSSKRLPDKASLFY